MPKDARTLHCENPECQREIAPDEPVHRTFRAYVRAWECATAVAGIGKLPPGDIAYLCAGCGQLPKWFGREPCEHCGRPVIADMRRRPEHVACSRYCRQRIHGALLNARMRQPREETSCRICGDPIDSTRSDAFYCSPKCKQKAYRHAKRYR
jgi:hypothetical protein